jgi:hypothetical protein
MIPPTMDGPRRIVTSFPPMHFALPLTQLAFALSTAASPLPALLIVHPLDTAVVTLDSGLSVAALAGDKPSRRNAPSPALLVVRRFHPAFGAAIAHAARRIEVIDSSTARIPLVDPDSSRLSLVVDALSCAQTTRTVGRRTVPPSPPGFDPTTGAMTPGVRRAYSEGPGLMTTLTATATWRIHDREGDSTVLSGRATGATTFRGAPRRSDWEQAARTLALQVLSQTPFSPHTSAPGKAQSEKALRP